MKAIDLTPNMNRQNFILDFKRRVIEPVRANPDILYKKYWQNTYKH